MNPARSLGPDVVGMTMSSFWIYLAGPAVGALAAVALAACLHGRPNRYERQAAQG